jgi:hypothetical protein
LKYRNRRIIAEAVPNKQVRQRSEDVVNDWSEDVVNENASESLESESVGDALHTSDKESFKVKTIIYILTISRIF